MGSIKKYTVWFLEKNQFDNLDALWCKYFEIKTIVYPLFSGREWVGDSIKLLTENETQVAMLKFKYDYRLIKIGERSLRHSECEDYGF